MKLLFTTLTLFIGHVMYCQNNADSLITKNRVKEVRILDMENNLASITKYDEQGRLIFNFLDNFNGATFLKTSITKLYNAKGNVIKTISTHSSFPKPTIWLYEYDDNGNRISIKTESDKYVFKYFYDSSNNLIRELAFDDNDSIRQTTIHQKFDNEKKKVSKITGNFIKNRTNTTYFDNFGNAFRNESYDNQKLNFSSIAEFQKNKIVKIVYKSDYGSNYFYNSNGFLIKRENFKIENSTEIATEFEEFTYNNEGLIITYHEDIYLNGVMRKYKYYYEFYD